MADSGVPLVSSNLAALCIGSFLYGILFVLFCASTYLMVERQHQLNSTGYLAARSLCKSPLFMAGIILFAANTAIWILIVYRAFMAFVHFDHGTSPASFYADFAEASELIKLIFIYISLLIGDAVIIYRVWVVWNHNKYVMIFPSCSFLACVVNIGIPSTNVFSCCKYACDFCDVMQLLVPYSLVVIAWRLWHVGSAVQPFGWHKTWRILAICIEGTVLDVTAMVVYFAVYEAGSHLQSMMVDILAPLSGISFMLINVRVGMGYAPHSQGTYNGIGHARSMPCMPQNTTIAPIAVTISRAVDCDVDIEADEVDITDKAIVRENISSA
ncbi:hypothetical protein BKA93DRAFT_738277 [Sparassis latifolia]